MNKPYSRTEYKSGKIKAIGNINFEYYVNTYQNRVSGIQGKFKRMSGKDERIKIWFEKSNDAFVADEIEKFKNLLDTVIVERFHVGNYTYSNSNIFLTDSLNNTCNERITWNDDNSLFIRNYCLGSEEPYMKKYTGIVVIE